MKEFIKKYWQLVAAFIFLVLGFFYYGRAYGNEIAGSPCEGVCFLGHPLAVKHQRLHYQALQYDDCQTNTQKYQFHKENAERCLEDAKNRCWWFPEISDRDKARYCFTNVGVLICPGDAKSKMIISLVTTLIQYGLDCTDEWHYINYKLYWSQYHYEMMEFYQNLVHNGHL